MLQIIKFEKTHWDQIREQAATQHLREYLSSAAVDALAACPHGFTAIRDDGVIQGFAGLVEHWPGRAEAWAEFSDTSRSDFLIIHRAVARFLHVAPYRRIEAAVNCDFPAAHRWIQMLGFKLEAERMISYDPTGADCALYARTK